MGENGEQGASERVTPTAWVCNECWTAVEQEMWPMFPCQCCTKWAERRGKQAPESDYGPLYSAETVRHLLELAYKRGLVDGECGMMWGIAELVGEMIEGEVTK